jgi:hypothetical protein
MQRRGFLAAVGAALGGLGLHQPPAQATTDEVDRWVAELDRNITEWLGWAGGEDLIAQAIDKLGTGTAELLAMMFTVADSKGPRTLFVEYRNWLAALTYGVGEQVILSGPSSGLRKKVLTPAIELGSWHPKRLRDPDAQRRFVTWKLYGLQGPPP